MTHKNKLIAMAALLLTAILVVYSNHWHNGFHDDDWHTITNNAFIRSVGNIPLFFKDVKTFSIVPPNRSYRPVVTTTLAIDYAVANLFTGDGLNVFWYHFSTFFLFLIQGFLLFFFFRKIFEIVQGSASVATENASVALSNRSDWIALIVTSIYMLHPGEAQTINYIIARSDSLSTFFLLLGFVVYQYFPSKRKYYLYLIPVIIGCLAKPTALMFAPILLVYAILFEQKAGFFDRKWINWNTVKSAVLQSFIVVAVLYFFMRRMEAAYYSPGGTSLFNYVITKPFVYLHYFTNFLLPTSFSAEWDWEPFDSVFDARCIIGFVFLAGLLCSMLYSSKFERWRPVSFGIAWFLIALVPTTFVPLADVMNDHRVFFPYIGLSLAVVWTLYIVLWPQLMRVPRPAIAVVLIAILCCYGIRTYSRNAVWRTDETLWKEVTIESPKNGRGEMVYGLGFMSRGSYDTAEHYFAEGLKYWPHYPILYLNMGIAKDATGDVAAAEQNFNTAIQYGPDNPDVYYYYAKFLAHHGRKDEAIGNIYKTLSISESNLDARHDLMLLLFDQRRLDELKKVASRTLELTPQDAEATKYLNLVASGNIPPKPTPTTAGEFLDLSLQYYQTHEFEKSIEAAKSALKLNPDYAEAWNNMCCAYNKLGRFAEGKAAGEEAVRLKPDYQLARNNLNWSIQELNKK